MNTYAKVQSLITAWKSQSLSRTDLIRAIAEACLGWPYCPQTFLVCHLLRPRRRKNLNPIR